MYPRARAWADSVLSLLLNNQVCCSYYQPVRNYKDSLVININIKWSLHIRTYWYCCDTSNNSFWPCLVLPMRPTALPRSLAARVSRRTQEPLNRALPGGRVGDKTSETTGIHCCCAGIVDRMSAVPVHSNFNNNYGEAVPAYQQQQQQQGQQGQAVVQQPTAFCKGVRKLLPVLLYFCSYLLL